MADEDIARRVTEQLSESGIELAVRTDVLKTTSPIAAYVTWPASRPGNVTFIQARLAPPPPPRKICRVAGLLDLAGYGRTRADGSVRLDIREFLCLDDPDIEEEDEVWVVATPRSSEPVYLTHLVLRPEELPGPHPPPDPNDIQVRIFAWDNAGQPKPAVSFTWRVLVHANALGEVE